MEEKPPLKRQDSQGINVSQPPTSIPTNENMEETKCNFECLEFLTKPPNQNLLGQEREKKKNITEIKTFGKEKEMAHLTRVSWPGSCDDSILGVLICTKSCKWLQKCTWIP